MHAAFGLLAAGEAGLGRRLGRLLPRAYNLKDISDYSTTKTVSAAQAGAAIRREAATTYDGHQGRVGFGGGAGRPTNGPRRASRARSTTISAGAPPPAGRPTSPTRAASCSGST